MKANQVQVQALNDTDPAALVTAVNAFLAGLGEATIITVQFSSAYTGAAVDYAALISYTK